MLRAFVRGRFEYPGVHLRFDGIAVVYLIIDLRVQLGFVHAELQSGIVDGGVDVVITRDFNGIFGFDDFFARLSIFQRPTFFEGRDISRICRDFAFQRLQLRDVDRVMIIGAACHIDDTAVVLLNLFFANRIFFISYRYDTVFFLEGFLG